jgi:hypothetical protein
LCQQGLGVAQQQVLQLPGAIELLLEQLPLEPIGRARALHHRPIGHGLPAHEQGNADDALVADHGDFG